MSWLSRMLKHEHSDTVFVLISLRELYVVILVDNRSSSIMYSVHDLQPGCAYQVIVTAENEAGEGPPSQPSSILTIPEECLYLQCVCCFLA